MKALPIAVSFSLFLACANAQSAWTRNSFLTGGFTQVKESANFGLVFNGPQVDYGMKWHRFDEKKCITIEFDVGLALMFSKDIPALGLNLTPIDAAYMFRLPLRTGSLYLGPALNLQYNYNLYPDLQSGFDYWFTNLSAGLGGLYDFEYQTSYFRILLNASLVGFTSRQADYRNPHFYEIGFANAVKHMHEDITPGSLSDYFTTRLECWWLPKPEARITFGYVFTYSGYNNAPQIDRMSHSIKLVFNQK